MQTLVIGSLVIFGVCFVVEFLRSPSSHLAYLLTLATIIKELNCTIHKRSCVEYNLNGVQIKFAVAMVFINNFKIYT